MCFLTRRSDPDMRKCNTIEELVQLAYDHLDTISPRGIAAFWSLLVKHVQNHSGGNSRAQLNEQLAKILCNTLENMKGYSYRDIATIALGLAKLNFVDKEPLLVVCTAFCTISLLASTPRTSTTYSAKLQCMLFPSFIHLKPDIYQI